MTNQERKENYFARNFKTEMCATCRHYMEHYVYLREFSKLDYGHCVYPRCKRRNAWDWCEHFNKRDRME